MTRLAVVPVADLLAWARQVDDEIGLDAVAEGLRTAANDPDANIIDALRRVRSMGLSDVCSSCRPPRHLCPYHEGWADAVDALEEELRGDAEQEEDVECLGPEGTCVTDHVAPCPLAGPAPEKGVS